MRFDHQPHFPAGFQLQRIARGQREVNFHLDSALHARGDDHIALLERDNAPRNHVARAQSDRRRGRQQNVAGANSYAQRRAHASPHQRSFQQKWAAVSRHAAGHGAAFGTDRLHDGIKNIFEADQLRDRFLLWRCDDFVGSALGNDASGVEHDHALAQGKNFLPAVRDIKNRNAVGLVPLAQIVDDLRLSGCVERGQRFVQKQARPGSVTRVRANATRWLSPPEISRG